MKCCGQDRTTRYCPDCGNKIDGDHPLDSLLQHIQANIVLKAKDIKEYQYRLSKNASYDWIQGRIIRTKELQAKWIAWKAALVEAIRNRDEKEGA